MKLMLLALLVTVTANSCGQAQAQGNAAATPSLVNPSFEAGGLNGWQVRGEEYGRAEIVRDPVASGSAALMMTASSRGSSGNNSLMVFQVLDPAAYRGRRVRFGAKIRTDGGAVNMTLYSPEGMSNEFYTEVKNGRYVERVKTYNVPKNASFLSFGIQVMGASGAKAYIDDVILDGGQQAQQQRSGIKWSDIFKPPPSAASSNNSASAASVGNTAQVRIDAGRPGADVNRMVFGMHLEWSDSGNGIMDDSGNTRDEVVSALRTAGIPLFRFPGGIHADYYDWRTGTEQRNRRATAKNIFNGRNEKHSFGSPEFIELAKSVGADMLITANYGTGTPEDAGEWARYFRSQNITPRFWEVGNEIYLADPGKEQPNGKRIAKTGEQYARDFPQFRRAILEATPNAKVGLIGHIDDGAFPISPNGRKDWTERMVREFKGEADFMAIHNGYAPVVINDSIRFNDTNSRLSAYRAMYAAPQQTARNIAEVLALLDSHGPTKGLPVAITEWGPLFGYSGKANVTGEYADHSRSMGAAIYTASMLDLFLGEPRLLMATYTNPIHEYYGSLLTDTPRGLIRTPTWHLFTMYRNRFESRLVPATVDAPRFSSNTVGLINSQSNVSEVLARASVSPNGRRLTAMLVNRSIDTAMATRVQVDGFPVGDVDCQVLAADAPHAINGPALTKTTVSGKTIAPAPISCSGGDQISVSIPPSGIVSIVAERR
jgi:alpha-L-arabinofuranosidase